MPSKLSTVLWTVPQKGYKNGWSVMDYHGGKLLYFRTFYFEQQFNNSQKKASIKLENYSLSKIIILNII